LELLSDGYTKKEDGTYEKMGEIIQSQ